MGTVWKYAIEEWNVPIPRRLRGTIRLKMPAVTKSAFKLDHAGRHYWQPVAPMARAEVEFDQARYVLAGPCLSR